MKQKEKVKLTIPGCGLMNRQMEGVAFAALGAAFVGLLILMLLTEQFPELIMLLSMFLIVTLLFLAFSTLFIKVRVTEHTLTMTCLGLPVKKLSAEKLRLFCAAGNDREDVLCLSERSPEELASLEEAHMLRRAVTKHEVPFLKQKANWQELFVKNFLLRRRRRPFGIFFDRRTILLDMDTVSCHKLRQALPKLPYRNLTEISAEPKGEMKTPSVGLSFGYPVEFRDDAIVLSRGEKEKRRLPLREVRTIVRVDEFTPQSRSTPHNLAILWVSTRSAEELAAMGDARETETELRIYDHAVKAAIRWTIKREDCIDLPCTAECFEKLRSLCKNARWIDLSDAWLKDRCGENN